MLQMTSLWNMFLVLLPCTSHPTQSLDTLVANHSAQIREHDVLVDGVREAMSVHFDPSASIQLENKSAEITGVAKNAGLSHWNLHGGTNGNPGRGVS